MKPETFDHILADINTRLLDARYDDPHLYPQLLQKTLHELGRVAQDGAVNSSSWAAGVLEQLHSRAVSGIPYGEPAERSYETTLDESERTGR